MKLIPLRDFSQKKSLLEELSPEDGTWVVSDLQSKWEIQETLLATNKVLEEDAVLRASEFWARLLFRVRSDWSLVSKELFDQWIWNWIHENPLPWVKANESASLIHAHLEFFAPLFLEENHDELMSEWFEKNPDAVIKWRHIYETCGKLWKDLEKTRMVSSALVPAVLLHELRRSAWSGSLWERKIYLDLGPQPRAVERSLAELLAEKMDVHFIESRVDLKNLELSGELLRLPTQLGEVKQVVASIRSLLDQGVKPSRLAVLAPDVEKFWPSLHYFLKIEGVPCNKPYVQRLIDDPSVQKWISLLRVRLDRFNRKDLESYFFQKSQKVELSFDEFRYYFETLKDPQEVMRWSHWQKEPGEWPGALSLTEFFEGALMDWPKHFSPEPLERVWKVLSRDYDPTLKMRAADWFFYVESKISKSETMIEEADEGGVKILSLSSAEWCEAEYVFFIGLNETELAPSSFLMVSRFEGEKLKQDLGFELDLPEISVDELYFSWISQKEFRGKYFVTSGVTFSGEEVAPSKYWLKSAFLHGAEKVKAVISPELTRFDEVAHSIKSPEEEPRFSPLEKVSLSATSIKAYFECPFTFFAGKGLKLEDQPVLDFDLDPLNKGRLLHAVLEEVAKNLFAFDSEEALSRLIDVRRAELRIALGEEKLWPAMKRELLELSKNFVSMEKELRSQRPALKTLGAEVGFEVYFQPEAGTFTGERNSVEDVKLTGRIDRVDGDGNGNAVVVDYKLSSGRLRGWSRWLEDGDLQMALYSLVLEEGLTELNDRFNVSGAYYLVPRTRERDKGFFLKGEEELFLSPSTRSHSWITSEKKSDLFSRMKEVLKEAAGEIRKGNFTPQPKKFETCDTCRWRGLCRAPHLI